MQNTLKDFKDWLEEPVPDSVVQTHEKAVAKLEECLPYEDALVCSYWIRESCAQHYSLEPHCLGANARKSAVTCPYKVHTPISQFHNNVQYWTSEKFWQATGQLKLANRMEYYSIGQSVVVWVQKPNFGSFCCSQPFVCQVDCAVARRTFQF